MKKIDSLNLIPFIDIMLVLLVIVLTSASFVVQSKVKIDVPQVEDNQSQSTDKKESHHITIDKEGRLFFDDKESSFDVLKERVGELNKTTQIIIRGDKESDLESFLSITTMLRDRGITDVYVITQDVKKGSK